MNAFQLEEDFIIPSPVTKIELYEFPHINLYLKRDDLIHPAISGNKWRKLKFFLPYFIKNNYDSLITFGGAF